MTKKLSFLLTAAVGIFAAVTVFVGIPAIIYESNPGEFAAPFLNIVAIYWPWAIGLMTLLIAPVILLPPRLAHAWSALVAVIALYIWAHGIFQTHSFGAMDGQSWSAIVPRRQILAEAVVIATGAALVFILAYKVPKVVAIFSLVLTAGLLLQSWPVVSKSKWVAVSDDVTMSEITKFSKDKNALVVLMDTMASDVFEDVVKENPELSKALDGFIFYPDTAAVSPTTYLALPSIHSGQIYKDGNSTAGFFQETVKNHSVLTKVAQAGYDSVLVNPIQNICPNEVKCLQVRSAMKSSSAAVRSEGVRVLDALLFRLAPLGLKEKVYNEGEWIIQPWTEDERFIQTAVMHNYFLQALADSVSVNSDVPTLKFLHLMNTHPPYVFTDTCGYGGRQLDRTRENFTIQVRCSLEKFVAVLQALKANNLYDQTAIILLADHGNYGLASTRTSVVGDRAKVVGAANPAFAIKPVGSKGPFKTAGGEIQLADFGATLCDLLEACSADSGISALKEPMGRVRIFNYYKWKHEFWRATSIKGLITYEIHGPIGTKSNWVKDAPIQIGQTIDFGANGSSRAIIWDGFSSPEAVGTWTEGSVATLVMNPDKLVPSQIIVQASGFVAGGPIHATVVVDEKQVGEMVFTEKNQGGRFAFDVPEDALSDGALKVDFLIAEPRSPKDLGLSGDKRKLGLLVHSFELAPRPN
jgi:hypothetical protein